MRYYLDASAMTKLFTPETGSVFLSGLMDRETDVGTARLGLVEVASALWRLVREQRTPALEVESVLPLLASPDPTAFAVFELDASIAERAVGCLQRHRLRASDAVHLATALLKNADVFVCSDNRLLAAAEAEGLTCLNPVAHATEDETDI